MQPDRRFHRDLFAGLAARAKIDEPSARHSIGYLANELLENAVKFRAPGDIVVEAALDGRSSPSPSRLRHARDGKRARLVGG